MSIVTIWSVFPNPVTYIIYMAIYRMVKNIDSKKLWQIWQITSNSPKFFSPIFTAFNRIAYGSDYPWRNIWPLVYGSIFSSSVSTSSLQYCSYYWMYFYNELTITCNLCHEALWHHLFHDSPIITRKSSNATKTTLHHALTNDLANDGYS